MNMLLFVLDLFYFCCVNHEFDLAYVKLLLLKDFMVIAVAEGAGQKFVATGKTDSQ